jgi:HSP20 family molecular chaperone IbpA
MPLASVQPIAFRGSVPSYPPYNIERASENAYRISVAVAGFTDADLAIETEENRLTIRGEKQTNDEEKTGDVLYQGIAARAFERTSSSPTMSRSRARAWRTGSYTSTSCASFRRR